MSVLTHIKHMTKTISAKLLGILAAFGLYKATLHISITPPAESPIKAVIFDLDGVLFTTSKKMYMHIVPYFPLYAARRLYDFKSLNIKKHYLEMLDIVEGESTISSFHNGQKMPQIMIDWQTGTDVADTVEKNIKDSSLPYGYKQLTLAIASNTFDAQKFIDSRTTISQGIELLHRLKSSGYKVYVLSNWDAQSFPLMKEKFANIFDLFDGIVTSGEAAHVKPNPQIFHTLLQRYNLQSQDCLFLDDERHNVEAAQRIGFNTVIFDRKNMDQTLQKIEKTGILKINE